MAKQHTAPDESKTPGAVSAEPARGYEQAIITAEIRNVRQAAEGTRNKALNDAAFNLWQALPQECWFDDLVEAARAVGLDSLEIGKTIASAGRGAAAKPRTGHRLPRSTVSTPAPPGDVVVFPTIDPDRPRTSWHPSTGEPADVDEQERPTVLARTDQAALFYPGRINGLIGESESGKTWVALEAVRQELDAGHTVLYLDFEDTHRGIVKRLKLMGADVARLHYAAPSERLTPAATADLYAALEQHPTLTVIDGFNAAMTLLGYDLMSNTDATSFAQNLLGPIAQTGTALVYIDHLPKNAETQGKGGIGAQAKRAMTTGCAIRVDVISEFAKGRNGRLKLTVDKDRPGHVREIAAAAKHVGEALIVSTEHHFTLTIEPAQDHGPDWRPTYLMGKVSDLLQAAGPLTKSAIRRDVTGDDKAIDKAITALQQAGHVALEPGRKGSIIVTLRTPFDPSSVLGASSVQLGDTEVKSCSVLGGRLNTTEHTELDERDTELRWDQK